MLIDPTKMYKQMGLGHIQGMLRTISITSVGIDGNQAPISITNAMRGKCKFRVQQSLMAAGYAKPETSYLFPLVSFTGPIGIKPGDLLEDDNELDPFGDQSQGIVYNILDVEHDEGWWYLTVINPRVAYNLVHTVDIYDIVPDRDAGGSEIGIAEKPLYLGIPALVQVISGGRQDIEGLQGTVEDTTIVLAQRCLLSHNSIIKWTDTRTGQGRVFGVKSWEMTERLDVIMQVKVDLQP